MPSFIFFPFPNANYADPVQGALLSFAYNAYVQLTTTPNGDLYVSSAAFGPSLMSLLDEVIFQFSKAQFASAYASLCDGCSMFTIIVSGTLTSHSLARTQTLTDDYRTAKEPQLVLL